MIVKINFQSAKVVLSEREKAPKDCIFDIEALRQGEEFRDRSDFRLPSDTDIIEKPFGMEQVSNLLHVLLGQRPVPSRQTSIRRRIPEIDEIAKKAWYRVDNVFHTVRTNSNGENVLDYVKECSRARKVKQNSNRKDMMTVGGDGFVYKNSVITWATLYQRYFFSNRPKYDLIMSKFEELYGSPSFVEDYSLVDLVRYLADEKGYGDVLTIFFEAMEIKPLVNVIEKADNCCGFNAASKYNPLWDFAVRVINTQMIYKIALNGSILVDIPDDFRRQLFGGKRVATFLDGGYAQIGDIQFGSLQSVGETENYKPITA